jgi:hypothetical protein
MLRREREERREREYRGGGCSPLEKRESRELSSSLESAISSLTSHVSEGTNLR